MINSKPQNIGILIERQSTQGVKTNLQEEKKNLKNINSWCSSRLNNGVDSVIFFVCVSLQTRLPLFFLTLTWSSKQTKTNKTNCNDSLCQ